MGLFRDEQKEGSTVETPSDVGVGAFAGKKIYVNGIESSAEDVIRLDKEGATLIFDTNPGRFLELSSGELGQLTKWNKERYMVCKDVFNAQKGNDPLHGVMDGLEFGPNRGSARTRLDIMGKDKRFKYWWETPDKVYDKIGKGWTIVQNTGEKTIHSDGTKVHKIGKRGEEELVLMKLPIEEANRINREKVEKHRRISEGVQKENESKIRQIGGKPMGDEDGRGVKFEPIGETGS